MNFQPQFLFDAEARPMRGKPLILYWSESKCLYLGLEPATNEDYYQPDPETIFIPKFPFGKLIDQHYKVNCKHLYCMEAAAMKELLRNNDLATHDLWESEEIRPEIKSELSKLKVVNKLNFIFEKALDKENNQGFEVYCTNSILTIDDLGNFARNNYNLFNIDYNFKNERTKLNFIYKIPAKNIGDDQLFLEAEESMKEVEVEKEPFYIDAFQDCWFGGELDPYYASDASFKNFFTKNHQDFCEALKTVAELKYELDLEFLQSLKEEIIKKNPDLKNQEKSLLPTKNKDEDEER